MSLRIINKAVDYTAAEKHGRIGIHYWSANNMEQETN